MSRYFLVLISSNLVCCPQISKQKQRGGWDGPIKINCFWVLAEGPTVRGCLHDTGTSFIPVRNLISYHVYMEVILPEWYKVSCEPSFLQVILEHCWLSTGIHYPSQSTQPLIFFCTVMKPRTSFTWYQYRMWSYFIPVRMFRTSTRTGVISYRYDSYSYNISYRYHVNEYRATSGHRNELVPEWNLLPVSFKHPLTFSQLDLMEEYMAVTQDVCRSLKANLEQLQVSEALTGYTNLLGKHTLLCVFKVKRAK